jgi:hypothetical protein
VGFLKFIEDFAVDNNNNIIYKSRIFTVPINSYYELFKDNIIIF